MKELRDQLWDFVYGLLDEADEAKLRQRITSDRQVAREYARVKLQSDLLAQAARANQAERDLPELPDRPAKADRRLSGVRLVVFSGSLALSLGLLLFAGVIYWSDATLLRGPAVAQALAEFEEESHPRLIVTGPQVLDPESDNTYDITVQTLNGESLSAPVVASLEDSDGNSLWYETLPTGTDGKRSVELPTEKLRGDGVRLKIAVAPEAAGGEPVAEGVPLDTWLPIQRHRGELSVINRVSDGERMYFREAEIRMHDRADFSSDGVDKRVEPSRSESVQRYKKSRSEDRFSLSDEASRVRWGTEEDNQLGQRSKFNARPADDAMDQKSKSGDAVKQVEESLSTAPSTAPALAPLSSGRPGADSRRDPSFDSPVATPRAAQPTPGTPDELASGRKEMPPHPAPTVDAPAPTPTATTPERFAPPHAEPKEFAQGKLSKSQENTRQLLLESVTANEKLIASRMVDGVEAAATLDQRIDDLRKDRKIDDKFSGRIEIALYDPAVAPPQKVAQSIVEIPPAIEPLNCTIRFDREEYREGELVTAELQVTDSNHQPLSAVLNVQVDALPLSESDAEQSPIPTDYLFTKAESPLVPLVFDNAVKQAESYQQSLSRKLAEQRQAQRHVALLLLGGSGVGAALLLVAGLLKWLPRPRYWLPVAGLLACSGWLGAFWFADVPLPVPAANPATPPLTTYGVQSQPPVAEKADSSQPGQTQTELELLRRTPDDRLTSNELRLPELATAEAAEVANGSTQTLFGMSDWERLAESTEGREPSTDKSAADASKSEPLHAGLGVDYSLDLLTPHWRMIPTDKPQQGASTNNATDLASKQTVYWNPRVTTDSAGKCRVQFSVPPGHLAHRITLIAHGNGQLGTKSKVVPVQILVASPR